MTYVLIFIGIILAACACTLQEVNFFLGLAAYVVSCICACIGWAMYPDASWLYGLITVGVCSLAGTGGYNKITEEFEVYHIANYIVGVLLCLAGFLLM